MLPRSGHAPGHLREMLCEAIQYAYVSKGEWWQWFETDEANDFIYGRERTAWDARDAKARARWLTTQLWNTTDIVAALDLEMCDLEPGKTYAQVVRRLRRTIEDSPKASGRPPKFGETMPVLHVNIPRDLMMELNTICDREEVTKAEATRQALGLWVAVRSEKQAAKGED